MSTFSKDFIITLLMACTNTDQLDEKMKGFSEEEVQAIEWMIFESIGKVMIDGAE